MLVNPVTSIRGRPLWLNPNTLATSQARLWRSSNPKGAAIMDQLGAVPTALWIGDWAPWDGDTSGAVRRTLQSAGTALVCFVVYNIPWRDLGNYSEGGLAAAEYRAWIRKVAAGIDRHCLVVLEPDALAMAADRMTGAQRNERMTLLADAVDVLTTAGAWVYLDAGDSDWIPAPTMAERLRLAGVARARGVALNVSHFEHQVEERRYAGELRALLGDRVNYVIDSCRNGRGPYELKAGEHAHAGWCNPPGVVGLGLRPSTAPIGAGCDAQLWVKGPVSSDGTREGAPAAGSAYPEQAVRMYHRALPRFSAPVASRATHLLTAAFAQPFVDPPARYS
jgi:endoglucanase